MAKQKNEEEIRAQYPDVVEGSLTHVKKEEIESMLGQEIAGREIDEQAIASLKRIVPKGEKRVVLRPCAETGELFFCATSDLHQSVHSPKVRKDKQRAKAKERKKARNATLKAENEQLRAELGSMEQEAETAAVA